MPGAHKHPNPHDFHSKHTKEDVGFEGLRGLTHGSACAPRMAQVKTHPVFDPFRIGPNPGPGPNAVQHRGLGLDRSPLAQDRECQNHLFHHESNGYDCDHHRQQPLNHDLHHHQGVDHGLDRELHHFQGVELGFDSEPRRDHAINRKPTFFQGFDRDAPLGFGRAPQHHH
jgi:hypothetical protein